jgi:hypothetical protein
LGFAFEKDKDEKKNIFLKNFFVFFFLKKKTKKKKKKKKKKKEARNPYTSQMNRERNNS